MGGGKKDELNGIPRKNDMLCNVPAELRIHDAVEAVERMEADERLTNAVCKLNEALNLVAEYVNEKAKL